MSLFFAESLRKLRKEKELSQRDLANKLYVTRATVARWESGARLPDAPMSSSRTDYFRFAFFAALAAASDLMAACAAARRAMGTR